MTIAYFRDWESEALEHYGVDLLNNIVGRLRLGGLSRSPLPGPIPDGPQFVYQPETDLFFGRHGRGPLEVAWDTNLLIDYFEYGWALWNGESLPELVPEEHGEQLEALQVVLALWVVRDIRFRVLRPTIDDSKKPLSQQRVQKRYRAWREFCAAISLVAYEDESIGEPLVLPDSVIGAALEQVPDGSDRELVAEAVRRHSHVFLTCDRGVLRAKAAFRPIGLRIASPQDLLEDLSVCGALHCLLAPDRCLWWPMPDQQRVAHLARALM